MKLLIRCLLIACLALGPNLTAKRPNFLFIAVDDLRPELKCYGAKHIHSPNIDKLAARGVLFERAYCMVPTCGASRAALMTGLRPARDRFVNYLTRASADAPGVKTLNTHFMENGYHTASLGKIFHHADDNIDGWSEKPWRQGGFTYNLPENKALVAKKKGSSRKPNRGPPYEAAAVPDELYRDGALSAHAVEVMERLAKSKDNKPFFLAVGFYKPHLPFNAPQKYWDLYPGKSIKLPENYRRIPKNAPAGAVHASGELRAYHGVPGRGPVSDDMARNLIRGYYACVSYTDAQVGKLLAALDRLKLTKDTVVVLWGDHGWNLGEHTMWCKHSCFETSLHAPLLIAAPKSKGGQRVRALVEFIDLYPTLSELAALPLPDHLQGQSLLPLLENPEAPWKPAAISRYRHGDTIRTDRHRFTQYSSTRQLPPTAMLYDHREDPDENRNRAQDSASKELVEQLGRQLREGMGKPSRK